MGDSVKTDPAEMRAYSAWLQQESGQFDTIREYVHSTACDKSGFTGLLAILQPGVDLVQSLYDKTLDFGKSKMDSAAQGVAQNAEQYEQQDQQHAQVFTGIDTGMGGAQ